MADPEDDKLAEVQTLQSEADNAWIKRWGEKYDPKAKKLSYDQCYYIQYKSDTIPIPPNITEAHRKELKEWLEDDVKWRKEKEEEEEKAKFKAFYSVFLCLGLFLFFFSPVYFLHRLFLNQGIYWFCVSIYLWVHLSSGVG